MTHLVNCEIFDKYFGNKKQEHYGIIKPFNEEIFVETLLINYFKSCPEFDECKLSILDPNKGTEVEDNTSTTTCTISVSLDTIQPNTCSLNIQLWN